VFVDSVELELSSGKGGAGCASFRREKFVARGGPDGGDGGDGGNLIVAVDNNTDTLSRYRGTHHYRAKNGESGGSRNKSGKSGEDLILKVPAGTQVFDALSNELLCDLTKEGESVVLLKGGKGGLGNIHFKSPTNQRPTYAQAGLAGKTIKARFELKLIADVGLVGFPNVGKSTLISAISHAKPEVANYAFTTITPHLGVVNVDDYSSFVMADIPGIIEGASDGKGLGLEFLRHIERTRMLLFVLDTMGEIPLTVQYEKLQLELKRYSAELATRTSAILFSRTDADLSAAKAKIAEFFRARAIEPSCDQDGFYGYEDDRTFFLAISAVSGFNLKTLVFRLNAMINRLKR
jgi:GTP-binding protein